jgi:hypothetical protein
MTWYVDDSVVYGQVPRLAPLVIAGLAPDENLARDSRL